MEIDAKRRIKTELLLRVALVGTLKAGTTTTFTVHGLTMLDSSTVYVLREGFRLGRRSTDIAVIDADNFTYDTTRLACCTHSSLWRCLSYRGSAGGYLLIECRGVAALQMRSSQ